MSKFGWTILLKNKNAQSIKDSFENILISSKRKPNLIETDRSREFQISITQNFSNDNNIKHYSRKTSLGADFAERFNRTFRHLLKRPVFKRGDANWIYVLPTTGKQYNVWVHTSTKLTPIQSSLRKNEGLVYSNLLDKRKTPNLKFQVDDLIRTADLKKTFSKRDTTNWSYKLFKTTEILNDAIRSYHLDNLPER